MAPLTKIKIKRTEPIVISIGIDKPVLKAARLMLRNRISGYTTGQKTASLIYINATF